MGIWHEPSSKNAFQLSVVSVLLTMVAAIIGIVYYVTQGSVLCLVFGLENVVDWLSSVVVLWRFYAPGKLTQEREDILRKREVRASTAISFILVLLGMGVIGTAAYDLKYGAESEYDMKLVIGIAFSSILIFGTLTILKFHYSRQLDSESLYKDGFCSLIGTVLAVALFVNTLVIRANPDLWWLDPFVAMVCGFAALTVGMHSIVVLCKRRVPICQPSWWLMSRGDGKDAPKTSGDDVDGNGSTTTDLELTVSGNKREDFGGGATTFSNEVV